MESPFPAPGKTIKVKTFLPGAGNEVGISAPLFSGVGWDRTWAGKVSVYGWRRAWPLFLHAVATEKVNHGIVNDA